MKNRQIMFFIILEDIELILKSIEAEVDIQYFKTGLMDDQKILQYNSIVDVPHFGFSLSGDWNRLDSYLVMKKETKLRIRDVPQRTGEMKFAVDQLINIKSIELKIGGKLKDVDNVIVAGRVATVSDDEDSNKLFNLFSSKIKKEFSKIGTFYVGKIAEEKLRLGWRLVTNEKSPKEYDLK